jgi:hypothetical protein
MVCGEGRKLGMPRLHVEISHSKSAMLVGSGRLEEHLSTSSTISNCRACGSRCNEAGYADSSVLSILFEVCGDTNMVSSDGSGEDLAFPAHTAINNVDLLGSHKHLQRDAMVTRNGTTPAL